MRLIGLTVDGDSKPGFAPWIEDAERRVQTIAAVSAKIRDNPDTYSGVYMMAGCGRLLGSRACGFAESGDELHTNWAGHDDHPIHEAVFEMAAVAPVMVQIGFPQTMLVGLERLYVDAARLYNTGAGGHTIVFDRSGGNGAELVDACYSVVKDAGVECRMESRPMNGPLYPTRKHVTMARRATLIMQDGGDLADDVIFFNNGNDLNHWNEALALIFERRGLVVVQPWETVA